MVWPITRDDVEGHLGVAPASPLDGAHLDRVTAAVVAFVEREVVADELPGYGVEVELGAVMLAARWYKRRGSELGIVSYGELGAGYVQRTDPDVAQLLGLGKPRVG